MKERRRHHRHHVWFPVQLDREDGGFGIVAACQDGSASGMLLRSPAVVDIGERVTVVFRVVRSQPRWFRLSGRVVRVAVELVIDDEDACAWPTQIGIELDEPSDKLAFLFEIAGTKNRPRGASRDHRASRRPTVPRPR